MKRKLYDKLIEWKTSTNRKPLLLQGARQVGKTYLLKEFAKNEYEQVVYLNLDSEKDRFEALFNDSIEPASIISKLETLLGIKVDIEKTLLIFDEIQEIPRALTSLKYFYENAPEYHIAASGSLLGIALREGTSFPVGKVDILELTPLDFEEFVTATSNERFLKMATTPENLNIVGDKLTELFREYLVVGGMPEAVSSFILDHDYTKVDQIQNAILLAYLNDISKHTDATTATRIHQIWDSLPAQFAKRNEKFMFNVIREGARAREYELAVQWLVDCRIVRKIPRLKTGDKLPLKAYLDPTAFKLYFLDIGLLRHLAGISNETILENDALFKEFNGLFAEQFVLQQMPEYPLYYWSSGASAEVDFVTEIKGNVIPIEVKSGTNVKAKSLKVFREKYQPRLSVRYSMLSLEYNQGLLNLPIFLAGLSEDYFNTYL